MESGCAKLNPEYRVHDAQAAAARPFLSDAAERRRTDDDGYTAAMLLAPAATRESSVAFVTLNSVEESTTSTTSRGKTTMWVSKNCQQENGSKRSRSFHSTLLAWYSIESEKKWKNLQSGVTILAISLKFTK